MTEGLIVKRNRNWDQKYRHAVAFRSQMGKMTEVLGSEVTVRDPKQKDDLPKTFQDKLFLYAWYVVDGQDSDMAVAIYSDVPLGNEGSWWFWSETTSDPFMSKVLALLEAEHITSKGD